MGRTQNDVGRTGRIEMEKQSAQEGYRGLGPMLLEAVMQAALST